MSGREYVITFDPDTDKSSIRLLAPSDKARLADGETAAMRTPWPDRVRGLAQYHVKASSALRAEQIARAMKGAAK